MYPNGGDQLVGVVGVHGVGAVRVPQTLGDSPKPTNVKVLMPILPTKRDVPPTFKGTHVGQLAIPRDKTLLAWKWDGKAWNAITQAQAASEVKAQGLKTAGVSAPKPVVKPTTPPPQPGHFVGEIFLPSDKTAHAWRWDGTVWRGISRSDAVKPTTAAVMANAAAAATTTPSLLDRLTQLVTPVVNAPVAPSSPAGAPPKPPTAPGTFVGMTFLPSNKAEHGWLWDGSKWRGIARSDALNPQATLDKLGIHTNVAANAQAAAAPSLLDRITSAVTKTAVASGHAEQTLFDKVVAKLKPVAPLPHPEVVTIAPGAAPPGYVPTSTGTPAKLPTKLDPDADGQIAPGKPAPPPTRGVPGTFPSTPLDPNGDGIVDATGQPAPPPTHGVPGTFPSTALDKNGDGIIDSTGASAPPPMVGQQGSFPATPDDANGDGLNDTTGQPLNANAFHAMGLDLGSMAVPLLGLAAALLLSGNRGHGGSVRQWR
jgi:hypothetical protein